MKELKKGMKFNELGSWYEVVADIIHSSDCLAMVTSISDYGRESFWILQRVGSVWQSYVQGNSRDSIQSLYAGMEERR